MSAEVKVKGLIFDLDGTLLDREGYLSEYTIETVRRMTDSGLLFTIATARSLLAANDLIWLLGLRLPSILVNGAMVFDTSQSRFSYAKTIHLSFILPMIEILEQHRLCAFLYTLQENKVSVYYRTFFRQWDEVYYSHRAERFQGRVYQVDNLFEVCRYNPPIYLVTCGDSDVLLRAQHALEKIRGVGTEIYCDVYNNFYFMDIFPSNGNKVDGVLYLQQYTGADEIVAFGDNFTDMKMLLAADRAYAPRNAIAAAKNIATEVLDYAHRDCVAHFLAKEHGWE